MRSAFTRLGLGLSSAQLDHLIALFDTDASGTIEYAELLDALGGAVEMHAAAQPQEQTAGKGGHHSAHEKTMASSKARRQQALAQLEKAKRALGRGPAAEEPEDSPPRDQDSEAASAQEVEAAAEQLKKLLDAQAEANRQLQDLQTAVHQAQAEAANAQQDAASWQGRAAEAQSVSAELEDQVQAREARVAELEKEDAARLRQQAMEIDATGRGRSPPRPADPPQVAANPAPSQARPGRAIGIQVFSSELPTFKKSIEAERQRYQEACDELKRKLASKQSKETKLRLAAERGQTLAEREVDQLGRRCGQAVRNALFSDL